MSCLAVYTDLVSSQAKYLSERRPGQDKEKISISPSLLASWIVWLLGSSLSVSQDAVSSLRCLLLLWYVKEKDVQKVVSHSFRDGMMMMMIRLVTSPPSYLSSLPHTQGHFNPFCFKNVFPGDPEFHMVCTFSLFFSCAGVESGKGRGKLGLLFFPCLFVLSSTYRGIEVDNKK